MAKPDREHLVGAAQVAHALGVSTRTVSRMVRSGRLPATKLGGSSSPLRVPRAVIEKLLAKGD